MREFASPESVSVPATGSVTDDLVALAERRPATVLFERETVAGWAEVSAADFHAEVRDLAGRLLAVGVAPGDRVAILSRTRYEWTLVDYALWYVGAVSVPLYDTSSVEQIRHVLADSGAEAIFVEDDAMASRVEEIRSDLPDLSSCWSMGGDARLEAAPVGDDDLDARRASLTPDHVATLIYTSGTTGHPRGCVLTHRNFLTECAAIAQEFQPVFGQPDASTILMLPLAHVFARTLQVVCVREGVRVRHLPSILHLPDELVDFRPTFLLGVPRIFEKLFTSASQQATADGRGSRFERATDVAISWSRARQAGHVPLPLRAQHALAERLVYAPLRESLGGRCRFAVSGGAPLGERLGHFFTGAGITMLEGYGLTESTAALTANVPDGVQIGTVGRPLPGTEVRVADDGELLFRGGQVFAGYWNDLDATAAVLDDDGWLHTGDLGEVDDSGFVRITGRKKEILVTAGGKNVAPGLLEDLLRAHPLIDQALVVGDGRPFVAALLTLDRETARGWARERGLSERLSDLARHPQLQAAVEDAVRQVNDSVSQAESIRRFVVLPATWTEESGELTPSLKLRRPLVAQRHASDIEALYSY